MKRSLVLVLSAILCIRCAAQEPALATPEAGFVSSEKYANAFFGFSLPLPQDAGLHGFVLPSKFHSLFGLQAQANGLTTFAIVAKETSDASSKAARKAAAGPKEQGTKEINIDGRSFGRATPNRKALSAKCERLTTRLQSMDICCRFKLFHLFRN